MKSLITLSLLKWSKHWFIYKLTRVIYETVTFFLSYQHWFYTNYWNTNDTHYIVSLCRRRCIVKLCVCICTACAQVTLRDEELLTLNYKPLWCRLRQLTKAPSINRPTYFMALWVLLVIGDTESLHTGCSKW